MEQVKTDTKRIFEIINHIRTRKQTAEDILSFCQTFIYQPPYQSHVIFPTKEEDLKVDIVEINDKHNGMGISGSFSRQDIALHMNYNKSIQKMGRVTFFLNLLVTLGHEYAHYLQYLAIFANKENPYFKLSEETKSIVDAMERNFSSDHLSQIFLMANKDAVKGMTKAQRKQFDKYLYFQLRYEENAQNCGYKFAKEVLAQLKADPNCDEDTLKFLTRCEEVLSKYWDKEQKRRNKETYSYARENYDLAMKEMSNIDEEQIKYMAETPLKMQVITNKLFAMREAGVDKFEYFRIYCYLLEFVPCSDRGLDRESADYLMDVDQKELLKYYYKNCDMDEGAELSIFLDTNFIVLEEPKFFSNEEVCEICRNWAEDGRFYLINNIIHATIDNEILKFIRYERGCEDINSIRESILSDPKLISQTEEAYNTILKLIKEPETFDNDTLLFLAEQGQFVLDVRDMIKGHEETEEDKLLKKELLRIYVKHIRDEIDNNTDEQE